jgi:hypothetical protein
MSVILLARTMLSSRQRTHQSLVMFMSTSALVTSSLIAAFSVGAVAAVDHVVTQETFGDTRAIVEFQRAADRYAFMHRQVERRIGLAHRHAGAAATVTEGNAFAAALIAERASADTALFTPAAAAVFRVIASRAARAPGCDPGSLRSGAAESSLHVNSAATGTNVISPCIVAALPNLPVELEYRSAGTVLVVVDVHANLVVDLLPALLAGSDTR